MRTVFTKSVTEIMSEYAPVYPLSHQWADTVEYLLNNDEEIILELKRQYQKDGKFREPVILSPSDPEDEDTKEDFMQGKVGYVTDGTHRLVSAYLLGAKEILAAHYHEETEDPDHVLVTSIHGIEKPVSDEEIDVIFDKLRSICVSDDLWITSGIASGDSGSVKIYWDDHGLGLIETINDAVIRKLEEVFSTTSFRALTVSEPWDL